MLWIGHRFSRACPPGASRPASRGQSPYLNQPVSISPLPQHIAQGPPKPIKPDLHDIPILQLHALSKAESISAKEMHMHIPRTPVPFELEVMMLHIAQAMR